MALLGTDTQVSGPVPDGVLLLETFQGKELLGTPYRYDLTLLSADPNIAVDKVLGQPMTVQIKLDTGDFRYFNGIVTYFAKTGLTMHHMRYVAVLNPKLALFDYTRDCRILFDADAPTHATDVLGKRGFTDVESGKLQGTYRKREYSVQYRETDFNFVQRLLEEEGIYYFFKHEKDKHTLVMADSGSAHAAVSGYDKVLYLPKERKQVREEEHFWSLRTAGSLYPGKFSILRGYDYTKPRPGSAQIVEKNSLVDQPGADFEDYDYPGGLSEKPDAEAEAAGRLEGDLVANTLIEVEGNTMGLGVGDLVKLRKPLSLGGEFNPFWDDADFDKEYLITSAIYSISINQYETGDVAKSDEPFKATYTLLDNQSRFRPAHSARKPRIEGPQTALVVGPSGDEIYTDKFGRVKVQFDWDRLGRRNEKSSIWVRVSQVWAGKQWGAMHIPRVGHEVIVAFLDGDPARPIITGRVYNTDNMPPYALPDNKTQSGIKSRSSKSGSADNFNELRFEDLKGKEEVHLQAEKDLTILVKNDETRTVQHDRVKDVGNNETTTVGGNRKEEVTKNEIITIHGNRTEIVDGNEQITVHGNRTETVDKNETITISGSRKETVTKDETVTIDGARRVNITKADHLTVGDGWTQTITGNDVLSVSKKRSVEVGDEITFKTGDASLTLKKDGTFTLKGKDVTLIASGQINAKASSDAIIKGSTVAIEKNAGGGGGGGGGGGAGAAPSKPVIPTPVVPSPNTSPAGGGTGPSPEASTTPAKKEPDRPAAAADKTKPTFAIAEFVQVLQFGGSEVSKIPTGWPQYVNLDEKTDPSKPHPECGRFIQLKVRVQCSDGSTSPAGQTVYLSYVAGAKNRTGLAAADKEGFGSAGGPSTTSVTTDGKGWTPVIKFWLSAYGGDEFSVVASLTPTSSPSDAKTGTYVVWRRIFYDVLEMKTKDGTGKYELSPAIQAKVKAGYQDVFIDLYDNGKRALGDYHDNFDEVEKAFKWADGYCTADQVPLKLHICVVDRVIPYAGSYGAQQKIAEDEADAVVFKSNQKISPYDYSGHAWLVKKEYQDGATWKTLPAKVTLDGDRGDRKFIVDFTGTPFSPSPTKKIKVRITFMKAGSYGGWGGANSLHLVLCRGTYEDMMSKSDADKQLTVACMHEPGHAMGLVSTTAAWHDASHSAHCKYAACTMWYQSSPGNERFHNESTSDPGCRTFLRQKALDENAMQTSWKFPR